MERYRKEGGRGASRSLRVNLGENDDLSMVEDSKSHPWARRYATKAHVTIRKRLHFSNLFVVTLFLFFSSTEQD